MKYFIIPNHLRATMNNGLFTHKMFFVDKGDNWFIVKPWELFAPVW